MVETPGKSWLLHETMLDCSNETWEMEWHSSGVGARLVDRPMIPLRID